MTKGKQGKGAMVYVLVIEHRHGEDFYVCRSWRSAQRRLDEYVRYWWDDEMEGREMPKSPARRIQDYFAEMSELRGKEFYNISKTEMLG